VVQNQVTPVFCGSAFQNIGIQPLLDGVVELLPSPLDRGTIRGWGVAGQEEIFRRPDLEDPLSALAFKCFRDPYRGPLTFLRVVSGSLTPNTRFLNATTGREERVAGIFRMQADNPQKLTEAGPGEIVAVAGFTGVRTGDTICDPEHPLVFESITFPEPVVHLAVKPKSRTDQGKLGLALNTLMKEDPTFKVTRNPDTEQTIISGMGELHLEVIIHRLASEFGVEVETEAPQVAYKIGISKRVLEVEGRYVKQTGGHGHFARIFIRLELLGGGKGFEFQNAITGGVLPRDYIRAVEKGLLEAVEEDLFAGLPVTGFRVVLFDGQYHPVDSSADDFKKAAIAALKSGIPQAGPVLLEPVMKLEIVVPEENLGAVIADVTRRKGVLQNTKAGMGARIVTAEVPLSETFGYANTLRGVTSGKGFFSMFFSHYARVFAERVPEEIARRMAREIPRT
jgi:elongation factor G